MSKTLLLYRCICILYRCIDVQICMYYIQLIFRNSDKIIHVVNLTIFSYLSKFTRTSSMTRTFCKFYQLQLTMSGTLNKNDIVCIIITRMLCSTTDTNNIHQCLMHQIKISSFKFHHNILSYSIYCLRSYKIFFCSELFLI